MKKLTMVLILMVAFYACKSGGTPFIPDPTPTEDMIEIKYVRTQPIINPNGADPSYVSWCTYGLTSDGRPSGGDPMNLGSTGPNEWQCQRRFESCLSPYYIWTGDAKVRSSGSTARTFYARVRGQQNWIELPVEPNELVTTGGEWAKFVFNRGVLSVPSSSSFSR
jgi:hypothetical protein